MSESQSTVYRCGQAAAKANNLHLEGDKYWSDKYWSSIAAVVLSEFLRGCAEDETVERIAGRISSFHLTHREIKTATRRVLLSLCDELGAQNADSAIDS